MTAASGRASTRLFPADTALHDTYYVVAHIHYLVALGAVFVAFAAIYLGLEWARRGPRRRRLGALHFLATFVGANLTLLPQHLLGLAPGLLPGSGGIEAFFLLNGVASIGYLVALIGQLFFVAVAFDAFRREPIPG